MKLDDNAVAKLAKVSDLIEQWHKEAFDRYAWEVEYQQRDGDMRVLIMAREGGEQIEKCGNEMGGIVWARCNGDSDDSGDDAHSLKSIRTLILAGLHEPTGT